MLACDPHLSGVWSLKECCVRYGGGAGKINPRIIGWDLSPPLEISSHGSNLKSDLVLHSRVVVVGGNGKWEVITCDAATSIKKKSINKKKQKQKRVNKKQKTCLSIIERNKLATCNIFFIGAGMRLQTPSHAFRLCC